MSGKARRIEQVESDENLMAQYATGDVEAFDELFGRYEPRAYAYFLKRTGSPQRAEDLYQELFLRIHRARDRYDPARSFSPWFFQIANRLLIDDRRRAFRSHELPIEDWDVPAEQATSEDILADREKAEQVLQSLSDEERYIILSTKVEGMGHPDLARQLGKTVDAVKKTSSRAIQRLRESESSWSSPRVRAY